MSFGKFQNFYSGAVTYDVESFRALDSVLLSVLSALEAEMVFIRNLVGGLLAELEDDIDRDKFKRLLHYSRKLASFQNRAKLVCEQIRRFNLLLNDPPILGSRGARGSLGARFIYLSFILHDLI